MIAELAIPFAATVQAKAPDIFEELWSMPYDWVEPPNQRRGGWSGASRVKLRDERGVEVPCILKKQQNHSYYSVRNGFIPKPTFDREVRNLRFLADRGIAVPEVLYHGRRKRPGCDQSLLLVPELVNYQPLTSIFNDEAAVARPDRLAVATAVGKAVRRLHHRVRWRHRTLYPKHIFFKNNDEGVDICFIDLENARPLRREAHVVDELSRLFRRAKKATLAEQVAFMKSYCDCGRMGPAERDLMKRIAGRK